MTIVCSSCGEAACAAGELLCDHARTASFRELVDDDVPGPGWIGFGRETKPGPATPANKLIGPDQFAAIAEPQDPEPPTNWISQARAHPCPECHGKRIPCSTCHGTRIDPAAAPARTLEDVKRTAARFGLSTSSGPNLTHAATETCRVCHRKVRLNELAAMSWRYDSAIAHPGDDPEVTVTFRGWTCRRCADNDG